jgi:hypothetical protein
MDNTDLGAGVCSNNSYGLLKRVCSADIAPFDALQRSMHQDHVCFSQMPADV